MLKLVGTLTSPYVRKVRIVLAEKRLEYELLIDSPWLESTQVARFNPLGKVPVLVFDDHSTLYDSRVIVEHVDNMTPNNKLIPASGRERIQVRRWEALADGMNDAAASIFLERKRPASQQSAEWIERQYAKIHQALTAMSAELGEHHWCHGNALSLADIAVGAALGYLAFRFAEIDWRTEHKNLAQIYDKLMERPSFKETVPVT